MFIQSTRPRRKTDIGPLDQCSTCRGWWPIDRTFYANARTKDCIACEVERTERKHERGAIAA